MELRLLTATQLLLHDELSYLRTTVHPLALAIGATLDARCLGTIAGGIEAIVRVPESVIELLGISECLVVLMLFIRQPLPRLTCALGQSRVGSSGRSGT